MAVPTHAEKPVSTVHRAQSRYDHATTVGFVAPWQ
jgi:hypothetical protein